MMQTAAILIAMFMVAWAIRGDIANNAVAIAKNTAIIEEMRNDIAEIRGALLAHVGGHNHTPTVALQDPKAETQ